MKYITGDITKSIFRKILLAASGVGGNRFVFWYYPEAENRKRVILLNLFKEYAIGQEKLEPVTLYWEKDEGKPVEESPIAYSFNNNTIKLLIENITRINKACDDIAIYGDGNPEWMAAVIFHERICLVKDISGIDELLINANIIYSNKAPDWF